ncbi:MAG: hypothetical protein JO314_11845 [Acidobacteria bacterium]|nr:hypothetical protein [Acidobacteriota bacterium]
MSNFPEKGLNVAISRIPQTDYNTATTPASNSFVREVLKQRTQPTIQPSSQNNASYATGYGFPTESWIEKWGTAWQWAFDLASQNIGRYLLAAMGSVVTSQPNAGTDPTVYQHVFSPLPFLTSSQLPAYSLVAQLLPGSNGLNRLLPSMTAKSLQINSSGLAKLDGAVSWMGSGKETTPSGVTWASHVNEVAGALNFFFAKQNEIILSDPDGSTNLVNVKCDIKKSSFTVENSFAEDDYGCPLFVNSDPSLGAIRSQYLLTDQKYGMQFTLKTRNDNPEHAAILAQTPFKIIQKWVGPTISNSYTHLLEITASLAKYSAVEDGFDQGFAIVNVTPDLLYSTTAAKIVSVKLINTVASYTT